MNDRAMDRNYQEGWRFAERELASQPLTVREAAARNLDTELAHVEWDSPQAWTHQRRAGIPGRPRGGITPAWVRCTDMLAHHQQPTKRRSS